MEFLNSSFFTTFLGASIIGILTIILEARISKASKLREHNKDIRQSKICLLSDLAQHSSRCLTLIQSIKKRQIWLADNKESRGNGLTYPDGRTFEETRDEYEKGITEYYSEKTLEALLLHATAITPNKSTKEEFHKLLDEYEKATHTFSLEDFNSRISTIRNKISELLTRFADEID